MKWSRSPTASTVAQAAKARINTCTTLTGDVVSHLRGDHDLFRHASGEVCVEIEPLVEHARSGQLSVGATCPA